MQTAVFAVLQIYCSCSILQFTAVCCNCSKSAVLQILQFAGAGSALCAAPEQGLYVTCAVCAQSTTRRAVHTAKLVHCEIVVDEQGKATCTFDVCSRPHAELSHTPKVVAEWGCGRRRRVLYIFPSTSATNHTPSSATRRRLWRCEVVVGEEG